MATPSDGEVQPTRNPRRHLEARCHLGYRESWCHIFGCDFTEVVKCQVTKEIREVRHSSRRGEHFNHSSSWHFAVRREALPELWIHDAVQGDVCHLPVTFMRNANHSPATLRKLRRGFASAVKSHSQHFSFSQDGAV